jgi:hypothetical protein
MRINSKACSFLFIFSFITTITLSTSSSSNIPRGIEDEDHNDEETIIRNLAERMKPSYLIFNDESSEALPTSPSDVDHAVNEDTLVSKSKPPPQQFFFLHHMKTGGTSVGSWLSCARRRFPQNLAHYSLSECGTSSFNDCMYSENPRCYNGLTTSPLAEFCAPLFAVNKFGWENSKAITMVRHPIDRVWSMFRFQTKGCFKCTDIKQVYQDIDAAKEAEKNGDLDLKNELLGKYGGGVCLPQISNHLTRNFLSLSDDAYLNATDDEIIEDALNNLRNKFTVVGVLERLSESIELYQYSFPWLAENVDDSDIACPYPHLNSSPSNNFCGENNTNWDLPDKPDEETRKVIEDHNQLDLKLYAAALELFEYQKKAMEYELDVE